MSLAPLIIVSGPSGSGKSTLIARLLEPGDLRLHLSVSATTRAPRDAERDGDAYHFWSTERFQEEVANDSFLEWAQVHGCYYGTLRREVTPFRQRGQLVILDIDVQGAAQVRATGTECVSIFLKASSLHAYEERLRKRGTETPASIERRLRGAERELARASEFDHQIVNDNLDKAVAQVRAILEGILQREAHAR